jgi:DNA-binding response OmpR family regulator
MPPERGAAVPDEATHSEGRRILVVDDEPHIRRILSTVLEREGFVIVEAIDGDKGLEAVKQGGFDFVILDFMMPGANGLEILAKIRTDPEQSDTPVIILTAKGQDTDREAALAGGADDFLTKPFSPMKLLARINEILDAR